MTGSVPSAAQGSSFYLGFLVLGKKKREAMHAVYGYCRLIDDIVDSGSLKTDEARKMLDFWREEVERLYRGHPTHTLGHRLLPHVQAFKLPKQPFLDLIDGCRMDLERKRYETFAELEKYLYGVAVTVGQLCVEIFGYQKTLPEEIREYARNMGYAFQLTNIMRDVGGDLEVGRIYLPLEDLQAAGCSVEDVLLRRHSDNFRKVMSQQYHRAKTHYQRAKNLLHPQDRPNMLPAEIMARVYEGVLDKIRENDYRVLFDRIGLGPWHKARLVMRAVMYSYGWN